MKIYIWRLVEVLVPSLMAAYLGVFLNLNWYIWVPAALIAYWIVIFAERVLLSMNRRSEEAKG